ncbi:MAG: PilZ domain-containing protein [Candidatus Acidiferrales bacterium]
MSQPFTVQRAEKRTDMKITALLVGTRGELGVEKAVTENVSPGGARVIAPTEWGSGDTILVALPDANFSSAARITYSAPFGRGQFSIGLKFIGSDEPLEVSSLAATFGGLQS